jgi:hypothetical protein
VAIQSRDEFDVVLGNILLSLERLGSERPNHAPLAQARRDLRQVAETVRAKAATKQTLEKLTKATEVVSSVAQDVDLDDKMLDLSDYLANSV